MLILLSQFESEHLLKGPFPTKTISVSNDIKGKELIERLKIEFTEMLTVSGRWDSRDILKVCFINEIEGSRGYYVTEQKDKSKSYYPLSFSNMPIVLRNNNGTIEEYE